MIEHIAPNLLVIFTLLVGSMNLISPLIIRKNFALRNSFLIATSIFFLGNVLLLDYIFLDGVESYLTILNLGKYSLALHMESLGMVFLTLLAILWVCALFYTIKFLDANKMENSNRFLFFVNMCMIIGCVISLSANLFTMFVFYELLTICTIPLISHQSNDAVISGLYNYLRILMISSLVLFLPAIIIIYNIVGHGDFLAGGIMKNHFPDIYSIILLLMFIFGITKSALYPLHNWLPSAMVASYPVSALLHAVLVVKTGLFCTYKVIVYTFGFSYLQMLFASYNWLVLIPIITIIYSSFQALRHTKIKMILAYSTINQLSVALLSAFMLTPKAMAAAVMHMVSHSFAKICIFYCAGNIYTVKHSYNMRELTGIRSTMPITSFILLISGLSIMGMPPFAGFISKFYIMLAAAEQQNLLVMGTLAFSTIFTSLYITRMLTFVYRPVTNDFKPHLKLNPDFDEFPNNSSSKKVISNNYIAEKKLPKFMIVSIILCSIGVIFFMFIQQAINKFMMFI